MSSSRFQKGSQPQRPQYRIQRRNGAPVPCSRWMHNNELGVPTPADPARGFPEPGCQAHLRGGIRAGIPCTVGSRDGVMRFFAHPDEPEWQQIPAVIALASADNAVRQLVQQSEPEWRRAGPVAVVNKEPSPQRAPREHRGKLVIVPEAATRTVARSRSRSRGRVFLDDGELSWGDHAYLLDNPDKAPFFEGLGLKNNFSGVIRAADAAKAEAAVAASRPAAASAHHARPATAAAGAGSNSSNWRQARPTTHRKHGHGRGHTAASVAKKRTQRNRRN